MYVFWYFDKYLEIAKQVDQIFVCLFAWLFVCFEFLLIVNEMTEFTSRMQFQYF